MSPRDATEGDLEDTIVEAALLAGWLVHAERPAGTVRGYRSAIKGVVGFPDITLVGYGRLIMLELKRRPNTPTVEQSEWLAELRSAGVDARLAYVPEELEAIIAELARRGRP